MKTNTSGGEAFASGGFGCVFYPALKCTNSKNRDTTKISKLLSNKYARSEYNEIKLISPILKKIPNYFNFFIIDNLTLCKPDKLTINDFVGFNNKCKSVTSKTTQTINSSLGEFSILNIPYGGVSVSKFIKSTQPNFYNNFINLNNSLINLLLNGIIPMNKLHVYHSDIKESNILIDIKNKILQTKLIDWGLSVRYFPETEFPAQWFNRPFQFNIPFSNIMFSDSFLTQFKLFMMNESNDKSLTKCKIFMKEFIKKFLKKKQGHYEYIQYVFSLIFDNISQYKNIIIDYNATILFKFKGTSYKQHELIQYIKTVYTKNIDVWGLVFTYIPILEAFNKSNTTLSPNMINASNNLKNIFVTYLYNTPTVPVDINKLVEELQSINYLFHTVVDTIKSTRVKTKRVTYHTKKTHTKRKR